MPERTVKLVLAIFAGIVAGTLLTTSSRSETATPEDCLSSPKGDAPQGTHWYYRIEHGTKRHCWYLRGQTERVSQAAPQNILPPARPAAPPAPPPNPAAQHSPADARAELSPQPVREGLPTPAQPAPANDAARPAVSDANTSSAVVASRWPDPSGAEPPASLEPANSNSASNVPVDSTTSPAPVDQAVIPDDADASPHRDRGIMPLLVAILGALALAAAIILRLGRPRRLQPRKVRVRRGPTLETTDDDRIVLSDHPLTGAHMRRPRFARSVAESEERKPEPYRRKSRRARA
jgi:hypothetical protein